MSDELETALLGLEIDGFCVNILHSNEHAILPLDLKFRSCPLCWSEQVLNSVIPTDVVPRVRERVVSSIEVRQAAGHPNPTGNTTFINVNQDAAPYFAAPRVLAVVERCFGPVPHTRIGGTSCVIHEPSQPSERSKLVPTAKGGLHSDWPGRLYQSPMWSTDRGAPPPGFDKLLAPAGGQSIMTDIQAFFMLTDFTESNGATMVRPGSHRHAVAPNAAPTDHPLMAPHRGELQVVAAAGSVLLFDGRLWHKTSTNRTAGRRIFIGVKYVPWWLNLHCRRPDSVEMRIQESAMPTDSSTFGGWPFVRAAVYDRLPPHVQPLFTHWVDREWGENDQAKEDALAGLPWGRERLQVKSNPRL